MTSLKSYLLRQTHPIVFPLPATEWPCFGYSLSDWSNMISNELTFRRASRTASPKYEYSTDRFKSTLKNFVQALNTGRFTKPLIDLSKEWVYSSYNWMSDLTIADPKCLDWMFFDPKEDDCSSTTIWFGTTGAFTPCHRDSYGLNIVVQLIGQKEWILFPPSDNNHLYQSRLPYEETSVFSKIDFNQEPIDLDKYPEFQHATPYRVVLNPGDVLCIPKHWWHFVRCLDTSVSVNRWFELPSDSDDRIEEAIAALAAARFQDLISINDRTFQPTHWELSFNVIRKELFAEKASTSSDDSSSAQSSQTECSDEEHDVFEEYDIRKVEPGVVAMTEHKAAKRKYSPVTDYDIMSAILHPEVLSLMREKIKLLNDSNR